MEIGFYSFLFLCFAFIPQLFYSPFHKHACNEVMCYPHSICYGDVQQSNEGGFAYFDPDPAVFSWMSSLTSIN